MLSERAYAAELAFLGVPFFGRRCFDFRLTDLWRGARRKRAHFGTSRLLVEYV